MCWGVLNSALAVEGMELDILREVSQDVEDRCGEGRREGFSEKACWNRMLGDAEVLRERCCHLC